ncbi:MAG: hypothetical protein EOM59_13050 [Clostridia bacterium]|nr:hypothetical protein [Clostridia bacterium]
MAKYYGRIGYNVQTEETSPGVWTPTIDERMYDFEIVRNNRNLQASSQGINDNININNQFSIVSDPYANRNFHSMLYLEFMGTKWKISNVEVQFPRLILTVGGVYNEQ